MRIRNKKKMRNFEKPQMLQLQTIDGCNAKCSFCPSWQINRTFKKMDNSLFEKVVLDFFSICESNPYIILFLQTEPLLDKDIFKKARWIKQIRLDVQLEIITNAYFLPDFTTEDLSIIDIMKTSVPYTLEEYNNIHVFKTTQKRFDDIWKVLNTNKQIANTIIKSYLNNTEKFGTKLSKAGFLNSDKIIYDTLSGCKKYKRNRIVDITYDGKWITCCMDYRSEIVFGDLNTQSITEILESKLYNDTFDMIEGKIESDDSFICKRCELAIGKIINEI